MLLRAGRGPRHISTDILRPSLQGGAEHEQSIPSTVTPARTSPKSSLSGLHGRDSRAVDCRLRDEIPRQLHQEREVARAPGWRDQTLIRLLFERTAAAGDGFRRP